MTSISVGRRVIVTLFVFLSVISLGVGLSVALGYSGNATSSDVRESTRRADCRSAYNADFTEVIRHRDDLKLELDSQYYEVQLLIARGAETAPTAEQIAAFADTKDDLDEARAQVAALPKLDDAVEHGYTLNGVSHPPCPVVAARSAAGGTTECATTRTRRATVAVAAILSRGGARATACSMRPTRRPRAGCSAVCSAPSASRGSRSQRSHGWRSLPPISASTSSPSPLRPLRGARHERRD